MINPTHAPTTSPGLKETLYSELGSQFTARLAQDGILPAAVQEALASLLTRSAVVSSDIVSALAATELEAVEVQGE